MFHKEKYDNGKLQKKNKPIGADGHRKRMRQRLFEALNHIIPSRYVLEMLLYHVSRVIDTRDIAINILSRHKKGLRSFLALPMDEMISYPGIGPQSAIFLKIVDEVANRLSSPTPFEAPTVCSDRESVSAFFKSQMGSIPASETRIAYFDVAHRLISFETLVDGPQLDYVAATSSILASPHLSLAQYIAILRVTSDSKPFRTPADATLLTNLKLHFECINVRVLEYVISNSESSISIINDCFI